METLRNNSEEKEVEEEKEKKENIRVCKWESVKKRLKGKNQGLCREARTSNVGRKKPEAWPYGGFQVVLEIVSHLRMSDS